jgi:hypothetical protein
MALKIESVQQSSRIPHFGPDNVKLLSEGLNIWISCPECTANGTGVYLTKETVGQPPPG